MRETKILLFLILAGFILSCTKQENPQIEAHGILDSTQIKISSKIPGRITEIYYEEGQRVKKGDLLFRIDCKDLELQLRQSEINLQISETQYKLIKKGARKEDIEQIRYSAEILKTNLEIAKNDFERARNLYAANAISKKALEDSELRVKVIEKQLEATNENLKKVSNISREEEIESARLKIESTKVAIEILKERISECDVFSPVDGVVTSRIFNTGEIINAGSTVYLITDNSRIFLKVYLKEKEVFKVKINDQARIRVDGIDREFPARVSYISDVAEFTPRNVYTKDERVKLVFMVKLIIENSDGLLKPGLPADALFPTLR